MELKIIMAYLKSQRIIASRILKCGITRVWFDPTRLADIEDAITADDIRRLVSDGVIRAVQKHGASNYRKNKLAEQKRKGRRKGRGSRKGHIGTRLRKKKTWISRIRSLRKLLVELRTDGRIDNKTYRDAYIKSKSGYFRSKAHVMLYLERNNLLKREGVKK